MPRYWENAEVVDFQDHPLVQKVGKNKETSGCKEPRVRRKVVEDQRVEVGRTTNGHDQQFDFIIKAMENH